MLGLPSVVGAQGRANAEGVSMPTLTLSADELVALTGYRQPARMVAWLDARQWVYEAPARRGDIPKVGRAYAEARMAGRQPEADSGRRVAPSADWMRQRVAA